MHTIRLQGKPRGPLKIAAIYLALSILWIIFSDRIVSALFHDPGLITRIQTLKGWFFVVVTACVIYYLLKREIFTYQVITDRHRKSRQELLDILDAMPVGVILTDGVTIEYVNISFSERFGYSLDEIPTDEQWFLLAYPDPAYRRELVAAWRAEMDRSRESGKSCRPFEVKVTCKNGTVRHAIANTQIINNRIVIILTDITERERLHNELIKMQKLESIGVLAGGLAHDFNNILTGILGNISYARMMLEPGHAAGQPLESAEKASQRAAELTRQLLTFAQGGEPIKQAVSVRSLIDEAVAFILRGTNVRGEIVIDDALWTVEADAGQLSQVLNNILINAVQAMPDGGVLRIAAGNQRLDTDNSWALPEGDYLRLDVVDEGCGIPEENLAYIFDPYFSTKASGSGLGLASAYSIVTRHGGHISAESAAGIGTTFTIFLPSSGQTAPVDSLNARRAVEGSGRFSILVMDDESIIRDLAATMLIHLGYEVRVCADGVEAIELYERSQADGAPYAAVIMDLTVPGGMGGLEASRRILNLDDNACLIVSSGYSHDPVMSEYRSHGFSGVLTKPYGVDELGTVLQTVLAARPIC
jgi:two-component system, cell cycle sensor histidine kinase and response regulator CckA